MTKIKDVFLLEGLNPCFGVVCVLVLAPDLNGVVVSGPLSSRNVSLWRAVGDKFLAFAHNVCG